MAVHTFESSFLAGVPNLLFFSEDDSADSSNQDEEEDEEEEDESEAAETDEPDTEELAIINDQLERRGGIVPANFNTSAPHVSASSRSNLAPHTMQWAVRQRTDNLMMGSNLNTTVASRSGTASAPTASGNYPRKSFVQTIFTHCL